ncbi:MAG: chorismate mutase [Actinomycetota bacterium]|nr:chorismate mutase [Actinomycetota bacterium]
MRALRGAITVSANDRDAIVAATEELLQEMISRNGIDADDLVSMIFTATPDLDAEFPARAARRLGLAHVPLLCSVELDVAGAMPSCVRVLVHLYTDRAATDLHHVYLRDARELRTDLHDEP